MARKPVARIFLMILISGLSAFAFQQTPTPSSGEQLPVPGRPVAADHSQLSEHNIEWMKTQPPQEQMEFLLQAAVNHDHGATDYINKMVEEWFGQLHSTPRWQVLQDTTLYSNDLRVRAAAIEINLAVYKLAKSPATIDNLVKAGERSVKNRPFAAWEMGMLANRGVELERVRGVLENYLHDPDQQTRFWAVEGLAHLGTDETIKDFVEVLHTDSSLDVRERAGCSLAKSGMLTREQRMKAVPGLIDVGEDNSLDPTTRSWVYQALREITNVNLPNDPAKWRTWWLNSGSAKVQEFHQSDSWAVLGNS